MGSTDQEVAEHKIDKDEAAGQGVTGLSIDLERDKFQRILIRELPGTVQNVTGSQKRSQLNRLVGQLTR